MPTKRLPLDQFKGRFGEGGARKGAGRKKGVPNKINAEARAKAVLDGPSPLDIMVDITRWHYKRWQAECRKRAPNEDAMVSKSKLAVEVAEKAAPYLHTRLRAVELTGKGGGAMQFMDMSNFTDEQLAQAETLAAALAAASGVAGADPGGEETEG